MICDYMRARRDAGRLIPAFASVTEAPAHGIALIAAVTVPEMEKPRRSAHFRPNIWPPPPPAEKRMRRAS
jgi:hypothetical protein